MKKTIIISLFLLAGIGAASAQETLVLEQIGGQPGNEAGSFMYCEIVATSKFMSNKITIKLDFGQQQDFWGNNSLRGPDGKPLVFNSMIDAMNWMGEDGWEFVQAYVVPYGESSYETHWLLKKEVAKLTPGERAATLERLTGN